MEVYCLGSKPWQPCYAVRLNTTTVMLDCSLDLSVLLNFLPLPLVYSPKLSGIAQWKAKDNAEEIPHSTAKLFRENVGHVFVDSAPLVRLPETGLLNVSTVDVLLVSNCFSMLALPFLTQLGFQGKIYATEPAMHFGGQLMEELASYVHRSAAHSNSNSEEWMSEEVWRALPDGILKESTDVQSWRHLYSEQEIKAAVSKIHPVSYLQKIDLFGHITATAVSSGFCLGSSNWLLETDYLKVSYVSSSSTFTTHPCPMERLRLASSDVMLLCGLTNAPSANPDTMLGELCGRMAITLRNGGNVLIPCYPTGVVYDLLECLNGFLDRAGLSYVPVYFISPVAKSSLSHSNIFAEWLCDAKQSKVYLPEHPFPHAEFIKSGRLKPFPNIHGELGSVYQSPCVVFTGHPSLRCGDAVHFMEAWGSSQKNAVIFTEPDFEYLHALAPYQPLSMKAFYFPIDPRLNFTIANKLLKEMAPQCLVTHEMYLPSSAHSQKDNLCLQPEMSYYGLSRGKVVSIPLKGQFQRIQLAPELADSLLPQEIYPGVSVTSIAGLLSSKNNKHVLRADCVPVTKQLWGHPSVDNIAQALREHGIVEVVIEGKPELRVIKVLGGKATLHVSPTSTTIHNCHDEKLRALIKDIIFRQLVQL